MKTYYLRRHEDVSGNSGCGRVAQVAEFDDGAAVLHWNSGANTSGVSSTELFASVSDLRCMVTRGDRCWSRLHGKTWLMQTPKRQM